MSALSFRGVHAEFIADDTPEIDFEGARYSGKTYACIAKIINSCLTHPGMEWLACRYSNEETKNTLRPEFLRLCGFYGIAVEWHADENAFWFPEISGLVSKVFAFGLKSQNQLQELAKVRGLDVASLWNDQSEELPRNVNEELRFATRKPGYPHQLIFSPNPPTEDHYLTDQFPEDNPLAHRKYYCVSLYDNAHNLPEGKIAELEAMYPPTHAKYKSLILGKRGVNVVGTPVYDRMFARERNVGPVSFDESRELYEGFQYGQHHPTWLVAQRTYRGGMQILGAILGKRMFLDQFLPIVQRYRREWFSDALFKTCCDPPPDIGLARYTNAQTLQAHGFAPIWRSNANAADVREAVIQDVAAAFLRPAKEGIRLSDDPARFLMASAEIEKHSKFVIDGFESAYVWDEHAISVSNKKLRQPKQDEWIDGAQRCVENIWLNFFAGRESDYDRDRRTRAARIVATDQPETNTHSRTAWMAS